MINFVAARMSTRNFGTGAVISARQVDDVTIFDISGRLTLGPPVNQLADAIRASVDGGVRKILLNLSEVAYIDSFGIGALNMGLNLIRQNGGTLKLVQTPKRVQDLLKLVGLHSLFDFQQDEAAAIRSYSLGG